MPPGARTRRLVVRQRAARSARPQRARAGARPLRRRDRRCHRPGAQDTVRVARPCGGAPVRRPLAPRARPGRAARRPLAAPGRDPRLPREGRRSSWPGRRVRRARLARAPRRSRRAPQRRLADRRPARRDRRRLRSTPRARCACDRPWARWGAARVARRDRAGRGRGPLRGSPRRLQGLRALPPPGRVGAEHHLPRARRDRARVVARDPTARRRGRRHRRDRRLRARRRLAALRRPGRCGGWACVPRLAPVPPARPLALPGARRCGPPRLDPGEPARARLPALVRRRGRDLPAAAEAAARARGLPADRVAAGRARRLDRVRSGDGADPVVPVRDRPGLLAACERARHARDRLHCSAWHSSGR